MGHGKGECAEGDEPPPAVYHFTCPGPGLANSFACCIYPPHLVNVPVLYVA